MGACSRAPRRSRSVGINFPLGLEVGGYNKQLNLNHFDLLIDWGWFYFITKPMFLLLDMLFRWTGNFGVAILIATVLLKTLFFPLANKSYASMAKMKAVQPQMQALRERYPDDKVKQQQELMELYKREKINPIAGCLPIAIQIPVFFALYKVLFVTIEMRHAPRSSAGSRTSRRPDPTNVFNLFGLIPFDLVAGAGDRPSFLVLGAWPLIMGVTMWFQMKLNPAPPDPAQKMVFDWMPVIFTFMMASFSSGLVIYWAWNNTLPGHPAVHHHAAPRRQRSSCSTISRCTWRAITGSFQEEEPPRVSGKRLIIRSQRGRLRCPRLWRPFTTPAKSGPAAGSFARRLAASVSAAGSPASLPRHDGRRDRLRGPPECRQVEPHQRADQPQRARAHLAHARPDPGAHLLHRR